MKSPPARSSTLTLSVATKSRLDFSRYRLGSSWTSGQEDENERAKGLAEAIQKGPFCEGRLNGAQRPAAARALFIEKEVEKRLQQKRSGKPLVSLQTFKSTRKIPQITLSISALDLAISTS